MVNDHTSAVVGVASTFRTRRRYRTTALILLTCLAVGCGALAYLDEQHRVGLRTEAFAFESGGNELAGTLHLPEATGPHGVVVFVPGDGATAPDPAMRFAWEELAGAGYATVTWAKPGVGGSTGNWLDQGMADRAREVVDAVDAVSRRNDLDIADLGLIGASQGGWVIPLVAEEVDADFVVAWSPAINWLDQGRYLTERQLDAADAAADLRRRVRRANAEGIEMLDGTYRRYEAWHDALDAELSPFFERMSRDRWRFVVRNHDLDARDALHALRGTPTLLLLGGQDDNVDVVDTERVYREILGGGCLTVALYPNANHDLVDHEGFGLTLTAILEPRKIFADGVLDVIRQHAAAPRGC